MQLKTTRTGSGVTEREVVDQEWLFSETEPDTLPWRLHIILSRMTTPDWQNEFKSLAGDVLRRLGLPSSFGHYRMDKDGHWIADEDFRANQLAFEKFRLNLHNIEPPRVSKYDDYRPLDQIAEDKFGLDSTPHLLAILLGMISTLEVRREINDYPGVEWQAIKIGHFLATLKFKNDWEDYALLGRKVKTGFAETRDRGAKVRVAKARTWKEPARRTATEIWQKHPALPITEVADRVRKRLKSSQDLTIPRTNWSFEDAIRDLKPQKHGNVS
jgi:hypothetical protein